MLRGNYKMYLIFVVIYGVCLAILVQGPARISVSDIRSSVAEALPERIEDSTLIAGILVSESTSISQAAAAYSSILFVIFSLAIIWLCRAMYEGVKVKVRDGFYRGMSGLVPFILVLLVIFVQLVPMALAGLFYSVTSLNGLVVNTVELVVLWVIIFALTLASFYFLASSIPALYIVSLPDVAPIEALRQSKKIVSGRRAKIIARMFVGALIYAIVAGAVLLLLVAVLPVAAPVWWWLSGVIALPVAHTYFYNLYRSLL